MKSLLRPTRLLPFSIPTLLLAAASCSPGAVGEAVRPAAPSAASAMQSENADAPIACRPGSYAEPLVVDLSAATRVDFEAAMDSGVALVQYDCKAVRLVKDCRLAGDYKFAGVSRKEEIIHLDSKEEIKANLAFSPLTKGSVEMDRAAALDVAYVLVGKRTTPALVNRTALEGSQCGEATHYVRAASVGAFAVQTSTKGRVAAAADVFGSSGSGASGSTKQNAKKDGNPKACEDSKPGAEQPPGECRAAIRFELVPIADKAIAKKGDDKSEGKQDGKNPPKTDGKGDKDKSSGQVLDDPCPEGYALSGGKCAKKAADAKVAHLCAPKDTVDCEAQCTAGHMGSCHNLANLAYGNYGKRDTSDKQNEQDETRAAELWKKACDADVLAACNAYGDARSSKTGTFARDYDVATAAYKKACDGGYGEACYTRADQLLTGSRGITKDPVAGFSLLTRACKLGESWACRDMGEYLFQGKYGIPKSPATADKLLGMFCSQGDIKACDDLGLHLLGLFDDDDKPEVANPDIPNAKVRGRAILEKVCRSTTNKAARACTVLGRVLAEDNDPKGRVLLTERCAADNHGDACMFLGRSFMDGKGGPADKAKGVELLLKSNDEDAMTRAAIAIQKGDGVKKDPAKAKSILEKLCKEEHHKAACEAGGGTSSAASAKAPPTTAKPTPKAPAVTPKKK